MLNINPIDIEKVSYQPARDAEYKPIAIEDVGYQPIAKEEESLPSGDPEESD
jgi:hypothetical protein